MKLESLEKLLLAELSDLVDAEEQLTKALPKMAKGATTPELRQAFEDHLAQTETHAERLTEISKLLRKRIPAKTCVAMKGLIKEGGEILKAEGDESVKDAALIGAAQRVEHYEIAAYGCARTFAEMLGLDDVAELLQVTLNEEAATDKKLTKIAKSAVNLEAANA